MGKTATRSAVVSVAAAVPAEGLTTAEVYPGAGVDLPALLVQARQGDGSAFAEIVSRFERLVRGVILRMTHDPTLSDDLSQDVFLQFWRVLPAFTSSAALPSWMKRVAINAVISHWRRVESQKRRLQALYAGGPSREVQRPEAQLIDEEDRNQVRAALEMIPADLRSILTLRTYESMSYEELADMLGLEIGTVRSRLFRARQRVKEVLKRWRRYQHRAADPV